MNTLVILLTGLLPTYLIRFSIIGIPTNFFEIAVLTTCIVYISYKKTRIQLLTSIRVIPKSIQIWICVFLLTAVISTFYSPVLRSSLGILKGWIVVPMLFGLLVHAAKRESRHIMHSVTLSGLVVALLGLSQVDGFMRIRSIFDVPNSLALFLVPVFIIASWVGIQKRDRFYQLSSVVMFTAIIFTQSFGAVIAILVTGLLAVSLSLIGERFRVYTERSRSVGVSIFFLVLLFFTLSGRMQYLISPLIQPNTTNSATVRLQLWDIGIQLIKKHPVLGIGLGQFEPAYQGELHRRFAEQANEAKSYKLVPEFVFRDPHNWIISFWLNMGLLGLMSFCSLNYLTLKNAFSNNADIYTQASALALISILIFGLVDTIFWKNDQSALWWLLLFSSNKFLTHGPFLRESRVI